jgi:hypothetical protein
MHVSPFNMSLWEAGFLGNWVLLSSVANSVR